MLYSLFRYLDEAYDIPGSGMFQYISFRSALAVILALLITIIFGRSIIRMLRRHQIGEEIRDLGLEGQALQARHPHDGRRADTVGGSGADASGGAAGQHIRAADARLDGVARVHRFSG
ncbi:MAG: hypothetical protein L6V80_01885 [Bacteroidales bacterium]|nr:MAG: hypothetical protein L6V80_01885 [Bacteroidales bacterium]